MKNIFITGGVVSGLGKGITAASLGRLLKARGYRVLSQKLDPYINVDPGTMSPTEHGEVFVTEDGAETDLDLGHYERFIDENLNQYSNLTSGKAYWNVLTKERNGDYHGKTVQVIPHITDEIKNFIQKVGENQNVDIVITEVGGTVGDIESLPFLEAIRQLRLEKQEEDTIVIHVTLVPFLTGSNELKTKPTQHSVHALQSLGIHPDILVARCDSELDNEIKAKISSFCNVKQANVITNGTVSNLYEVPRMLEQQDMSKIVLERFQMPLNELNMEEWDTMLNKIKQCSMTLKIALVGKYSKLHDAYCSVIESLNHAGHEFASKIEIKWIEAEELTKDNMNELLQDCSGILVPGGFGERGIEGMIIAANYARNQNVPYLGICLGMQIACIEFARNVLGYDEANSTEFNAHTNYPIIHIMEDQKSKTELGGTLRKGSYPCVLDINSQSYKYYGEAFIHERHRHRYEFNNTYRQCFEEKGMHIVGTSPDKNLVEVIENRTCDYFVGVQFHPEFKSRPNRPHPLFIGFIEHCYQQQRRSK